MFKAQTQLLALDSYDERVADVIPLPILLTDGSGWCLYVNASWVQLTGLDRTSSLGRGWLEAIAEADIDNLNTHWANPTNPHTPITLELRTQKLNSECRWVQMTSGTVTDSYGAVLRINAFSNISNIIALSSALAQSMEEFRQLAEAMPQLVWSADAQGLVTYFNGPWLAYTGLTVLDVEQGLFTSIVHPDDIDETRTRWMGAFESGQGFELQYRLLSKVDKSYKWFIARSTPVHDADGKIIRWVGTATDIDEQKRSSDKLEFLLEVENAFSSTLDSQEICDKLASLAVKRFCDWCFVLLVEDDGVLVTSSVAHQAGNNVSYVAEVSKNYPPENKGMLAQVLSTNKPQLIPILLAEDVAKAARSPEHLQMLQMLNMHSLMIVPLSTDVGKVYGAVVLVSSESRRIFEFGDVDISKLVAQRAAIALQNARAYNNERMTAENLRFIAKASKILFDSFDVHLVLQQMLNLVVEDICDFAVVLLIESSTHLRCAAVAHADPDLKAQANVFLKERPFTLEMEHDLVDIIKDKIPFKKNNLEGKTCGVWEYLVPELERLRLRTSLTVPLYSRGTAYGALIVYYTNHSNRTVHDWDLALFSDLGRRTSIAIKNSLVYTRERRIAETLQKSLLPSSLPVIQGIRFCAEYIPSSKEAEIGGDWYDAFALKDGTIVISVGDVLGRGLNAARIMGILRQAIGVMAMTEHDPVAVLNAIDYLFCQYGQNSIATAFLAYINLTTKTITYANAGHPYGIVRTSTNIIELNESKGLPLGLRTEFGCYEISSQIVIDDIQLLVMYTDGLIESTQDVIAGEQKLHAALTSDAVLHVRDQACFIRDICTVEAYKDDVAILSMRFESGEHWSFDAENARAAHDSRGEFVRYLEKYADDLESISPVELIFGELIGNVVRHAPGPIDVHVDWDALQPTLHVIDRGSGFIGAGELPDDPLSEGGRGLFIIKAICTAFTVERIEGYGNHVAVVLPINRKVNIASLASL